MSIQKIIIYIWTASPKAEILDIGNFVYKSMESNFRLWFNVKFLIFCLGNAVKLRKIGENVDLVTTYDHLKTGIIGLIVSRILSAKFTPEVNGVYTSLAELLDMPDTLLIKAKRRVYPIIMKFVLKKADGIKLLFGNQIQNSKRLGGRTVYA